MQGTLMQGVAESLHHFPPTPPPVFCLSSAAVTLCSDNVRSWFSLRQTWGQPSHTVTHPLLSRQQHDFVVVMATAAHSYLTDLPWDNVKEMKEKGFFCVCAWLCANHWQRWVVLDRRQRRYVSAASYAPEVKMSLCRRCEGGYSHLLLAGG